MSDATTIELLALNRRLLESIAAGDWATYEELCDPSLTCFEPEARGQWVEGMEFHHFYFKLGGAVAGEYHRQRAARAGDGRRGGGQLHPAGAEARRRRQSRDGPVGGNPRLAAPRRPLAARAFPPRRRVEPGGHNLLKLDPITPSAVSA